MGLIAAGIWGRRQVRCVEGRVAACLLLLQWMGRLGGQCSKSATSSLAPEKGRCYPRLPYVGGGRWRGLKDGVGQARLDSPRALPTYGGGRGKLGVAPSRGISRLETKAERTCSP